MNQQILQGKWHQMRGSIKERWGRLNDDDLNRIQGRVEQLIGVIQERYGYTRQQAKREVEHYLDAYNEQSDQMQEQVQNAMDEAPDRIGRTFRKSWTALIVAVGIFFLVSYMLKSKDKS